MDNSQNKQGLPEGSHSLIALIFTLIIFLIGTIAKLYLVPVIGLIWTLVICLPMITLLFIGILKFLFNDESDL